MRQQQKWFSEGLLRVQLSMSEHRRPKTGLSLRELLLQIVQCPRRYKTLKSNLNPDPRPEIFCCESLIAITLLSRHRMYTSLPSLNVEYKYNPQLSGRPAQEKTLLLHIAFVLHNILVMAARLPFLKICSTGASAFQSGTQTQPQPSYLYPIPWVLSGSFVARRRFDLCTCRFDHGSGVGCT